MITIILPNKQQIEEHREKWAKTAEIHGWLVSPFFIQVWYDVDSGEIMDSVSHQGLKRDILIGCEGRDEEGWAREVQLDES